MSNEFVMVPREHELKIRQTPLADLLSGLKTGEIRDCSDREFAVGDTVLLREIDDAREYTGTVLRRTITHVQKNYGLPDHLCVLSYGQPAEQHQGERVRLGDGDLIRMANKAAPHHDRDNDMFYIAMGRLVEAHYTHAVPGEVERLESLLRASRTSLDNCALQIENLQAMLAAEKKQHAQVLELATRRWNYIAKQDAQLAERDALLREVANSAAWGIADLRERIEKLLTASPEPSAPEGLDPRECRKCGSLTAEKCKAGGCWFEREPSASVERDERAAYEAWHLSRGDCSGMSIHAWQAWQARAALGRKP